MRIATLMIAAALTAAAAHGECMDEWASRVPDTAKHFPEETKSFGGVLGGGMVVSRERRELSETVGGTEVLWAWEGPMNCVTAVQAEVSFNISVGEEMPIGVLYAVSQFQSREELGKLIAEVGKETGQKFAVRANELALEMTLSGADEQEQPLKVETQSEAITTTLDREMTIAIHSESVWSGTDFGPLGMTMSVREVLQ